MSAGNTLPTRPMSVRLMGEDRLIRYTMRSLAWLADRHGNVNAVLDSFVAMQSGQITANDLHGLSDFVCAGLRSYDEDVTPEQIENEVDIAEILDIMPILVEAFSMALGTRPKQKESEDPPSA